MISYKFIACLFFLLSLSCSFNALAVEDEADIRRAVEESILSEKIVAIRKNNLEEIGIYISSQDTGGNESVIQFKFSNEIIKLIKKGKVELRFSLLDDTKSLITSMHQYLGGPADLFVAQGNIFRIALVSKCDFKMLDEGTVYTFDYVDY